MDTVLASLGQLLLKAIPTVVIVLALHFYLKAMFFRPLEKALAERKSATTGTRHAAQEALDKAQKKAAEYDAKLREARGEIYKEQEEARRQLREEQAAAMAATREKLDARLRDARLEIESQKQAVLKSLDNESDVLAEQIARSVLAGGAN